jgi:hypothetical protein
MEQMNVEYFPVATFIQYNRVTKLRHSGKIVPRRCALWGTVSLNT